MPSTSTERKQKQRKRDRQDPDRKFKKLDSIYMFGEVDVSIIIDIDENIWFKGVDIARALEMESVNQSIYETLDKKYCKRYEKLTLTFKECQNISNIHPKTTFINETGMNMFVLRSRKPKAEEFAEWVCGEVLPSIRKFNKYEVDPANNPYKELNDYLQKQIKELKTENTDLKTENTDLKNMNKVLMNKTQTMETEKNELIGDVRKYTQHLFEMKPSCVPTLNNETKREYFVLYRKDNTQNYTYPYYACRVQLDSLEQRRNELLKEYPMMEKLLQLSVPNSVTFFNFIREQMPNYIVRGDGQSFRIKDISEVQMLTMIENLYRSLHGAIKK